MPLSPRHWRARHLLGAWVLYWVALIAVAVGPGAFALWRLRDAPPSTSSASFGFGDRGLEGKVVSNGAAVWEGAVSGWTALLWLVIPPLLLWLLWLVLRPRAAAGAPAAVGHPPRELGAGDAAWRAPAAARPEEQRAPTPPRRDL